MSASSAQPGGPWAPPLFNTLPEVDRATLEAWARGEAAPSDAAKASPLTRTLTLTLTPTRTPTPTQPHPQL